MDNITETSSNPYKVLKMDSGDDIICKILKEFADAFVVERPMAIREEPQFNEQFGEVVNQTGLSRWMNFTNETEFVVYKSKILATANLAPELRYYYKHLCTKLIAEEHNQVKTEEEAAQKMKQIKEHTMAMIEDLGDDDEDKLSNILPFGVPDKSKLH